MGRAASVSILLVAVLAGCGGGGSSTPSKTPTAARAGAAAQGKALFSSLGCQSCHSISGATVVGPPLNGVAGSKVALANGQSVTADDAYLMQSIEDPDAKVVKGFKAGVMSARIKPHSVSTTDAKALVAYIKTLH